MKGVVVLSSRSATVKEVAETLTEFLEKVFLFLFFCFGGFPVLFFEPSWMRGRSSSLSFFI